MVCLVGVKRGRELENNPTILSRQRSTTVCDDEYGAHTSSLSDSIRKVERKRNERSMVLFFSRSNSEVKMTMQQKIAPSAQEDVPNDAHHP
jgi:hypothetical protein